MIVAVEAHDGQGVTVYERIGLEGETYSTHHLYRPWIAIPSDSGHCLHNKPFVPLQGGYYQRVVSYEKWANYRRACRVIRESHDDMMTYPSPVKNYLVGENVRLFEGGRFDDLRRVIVDIETTGLDPETSELLMIAMITPEGEEVWVGGEKYLLKMFCNRLRSLDPDTVEGHNIVGFDLPFMLARMAYHGMAAVWGRDNKEAVIGRSRTMMIGPNERQYTPVYIPGRHVLDTYIQIQKHDVALQKHQSYGLKAVARDLGIAEPDRVELDREKIAELYLQDSGLVERYAIQDVRETKRLADIVFPQVFYMTQSIPDSLQGVATTGTGESWNAIMIAEYLARGLGIPERQLTQSYVGGLVECRRTGVIWNVVKADVESLYPSIMLENDIQGCWDTEGIMLPLLRSMRSDRLEAKKLAKEAPTAEARAYWDGVQNARKVFINSAYGFLGGPFHFADWRAAERVTAKGREIVADVARMLEDRGAEIIEIDTDGVFFSPSPHDRLAGLQDIMIQSVSDQLPQGINLVPDGSYLAMLSLGMKNYALLNLDRTVTIKGASLKNRGLEPFLATLLKVVIGSAWDDNLLFTETYYRNLMRNIYHNALEGTDWARRERITEKTFTSPAKARLAAACPDAKVGDYVWVYERDDGSLSTDIPVSGKLYDVNRLYYMKKTQAVLSRLKVLWAADFDEKFPKPGKKNMHSIVGAPDPPKVVKPRAPRFPVLAPKKVWDFDAEIPFGCM